jgi:hypothetical protein
MRENKKKAKIENSNITITCSRLRKQSSKIEHTFLKKLKIKRGKKRKNNNNNNNN